MLGYVYLTCLIVMLRLALRSPTAPRLLSFDRVTFPLGLRCGAGIMLPLLFLIQTRINVFQAAFDGVHDPFYKTLPIPIVDQPFGTVHGAISVATFACFALMTSALFVLCWGPLHERRLHVTIVLAALALAVIAISAPVLTTSDPYFYLYAGRMGFAAYSPPEHLLLASDRAMDRFVSLRGLLYGPLWIEINRFVVSFGSGAREQLLLLRSFGVLLIVAATFILRRLGTPDRVQLAFFLNPMLWFFFVLNAHNDLMAIVLCLIALLPGPAFPILAIVFVALAGCIKLPFLIFGSVAFVRLAHWQARVAAAIAAGALCFSIYWLIGGTPYLNGFLGYVSHRGGSPSTVVTVFTLVALATSMTLIAVAVVRSRFLVGGALAIPFLATFTFPWYLAWGLPYAVAAGSGLFATLIAMPVTAILMDGEYNLNDVAHIVFTIVASAALFDIAFVRIVRRRSTGNLPG